MPYAEGSAEALATGCVDSIDFEVAFKPTPYVQVESGDSTCRQGAAAVLTAINERNTNVRTFTWYKYAGPFDLTPLDSVGNELNLNVPIQDGSQFFRLRVVDTSNNLSCEAYYPPYGESASVVRNALDVVSRFRLDFTTSGSASFPVTVRYVNTSYYLVNGTDTVTLADADSISYDWNLDDGTGPRATSRLYSEDLVRTFQGPNMGDSLVINPTLSAYDPIAKGLDVAACINQATQKLVVRLPFFPNVILPGDGDPRNDFLRFQKEEGFYNLEVFNRWGSLIYKTDGYKNDWGGEGQPAGVYYYVATDRLSNNALKGWLQIIK
jgi:hypothetical protein